MYSEIYFSTRQIAKIKKKQQKNKWYTEAYLLSAHAN